MPPHPRKHYHEKHHPIDQDSMLAKAQALKHLVSLGMAPQMGAIPVSAQAESTKALMIKPPKGKARGIMIHQLFKQPGM